MGRRTVAPDTLGTVSHSPIAMTRTHRFAVALAAGLLVSATASAQPARPAGGHADLGARLDRIATALDLGADQRAALDAVADRYADADRPALWQAAADVEAVLTDAQVEALRAQVRDRLEALRDGRGGDRARPGRRDRAGQGRAGRGGRPGRAGQGRPAQDRQGDRAGRLSDEQREAVREVREAYRPRFEALRASFRDGDLSAGAFAVQRRALREALGDDLRAVLPAETVARFDDREARREAEREAREQALGLTAEQRDALAALRLDRLREAAARPAPTSRPARGERPTREERQARSEQVRERREAVRAEIDAILTTDQRDVLDLHRALAAGGRGRMGRGGRSGGGRAAEAAPPTAAPALQADDAPTALSVDAVSPNPAAGRIRLAYAVPEGGAVRLEVFDVRGRRVMEQSAQAPGAGRYDAALDVGDLVPGVYLVRVTAGGAAAEGRFTVAR